MKKILILSILLSFLAINQNYAAIGCQEKSWHLKKKYDHKVYHYVQCNCPATNIHNVQMAPAPNAGIDMIQVKDLLFCLNFRRKN